MRLIARHPSFASLRGFALTQLGEPSRRRVAQHLERCPRCREEVARVRRIVAATVEVESPPAGALELILARRASREHVLLPATEPVHRRRVRHMPRVAAAALLLVTALYVRTRELEAERSELRMTPEAPRAGEAIRLEYRATSRLENEAKLVVRARFRTPQSANDRRHAVLGTLERTRDGVFAGTVRLPDSAVYAVLAVEDTLARFVDYHGEQWDVLLHAGDGLPLFESLFERYVDTRMRDTRLGPAIIADMTRLYPHRPEGWRDVLYTQTSTVPSAVADSIRGEHRARYLPLVARGIEQAGSVDVRLLGAAVFYADAVGDTAMMAHWKTLLYERYPRHEYTLQRRVFDLSTEHRGQPARLMEAYERMFEKQGASAQLTYSAFNLAVTQDNEEAIGRWAPRLVDAVPWTAEWVGTTLGKYAGHRPVALQLLRHEIARYSNSGDRPPAGGSRVIDTPGFERPLTQTGEEYAELRRLRVGGLLTTHGTTLLASGDTLAALDTLKLAFDAGWDAQRFRTIGELYHALGDTAGAAEAFARLAADPTTTAAADSLRARLGGAGADPGWTEKVTAAKAVMKDEIWRGSVNRAPLLPRLRLKDAEGRAHVAELAQGKPVLVTFWSRYCPPSFAQLEELARVAARLENEGTRVITVTDEAPASAREFLREKGYRFPVFFDPDRDSAAAFDTPGTPTYYVLDADGRIRFAHHEVSRVIREVAALRDLH